MTPLKDRAGALGILLDEGQADQLARLSALLQVANARMNLTSITEPAEIETRHLLDSLTAAVPLLERLHAGAVPRLVDVGAGGGFPGLPLKIAFPAMGVTLVEATRKKAAFLEEAVEALGLRNVQVVARRAEEAARDPLHRDQYDWATARALGPLAVVVELCAPFLRPGGVLVAQRRGDLAAEVAANQRAWRELRLRPREPVAIEVEGLADGRGLIVAEKVGSTPEHYPRRVGMPAKAPL
jgi:16S rRNA (guanine527-N7)-methyltransferase